MQLNQQQINTIENLKEALTEYPEAGVELDSGCSGDGPVANFLVAFGVYDDIDQATDAIFGDCE